MIGAAVLLTLRRWGRGLRSGGRALLQFVRDGFFPRLLRLTLRVPLSLLPVAMLLGAAAFACLAGAQATGRTVLDARLAMGAAPVSAWLTAGFAALLFLEISAAATLALASATLTFAGELGRRRIGTLLAGFAFVLAGAAGLDLTFDPGAGRVFLGIPVPVLSALVAILFALWFQRVYLRPLGRGFRDYRWDMAGGRVALTELSHGR